MPSLFRFLAVLGAIFGVVMGSLYAAAVMLEPVPKDTSAPVAVKIRR